MKKYFILITLMFFIGCGSTSSVFPLTVNVTDSNINLKAAVLDTNYAFNKFLSHGNDLFKLSINGDADIFIRCADQYEIDNSIENGLVEKRVIGLHQNGNIIILCEAVGDYKKKAIIVAHELFHALGFREHYDNPECLNYPLIHVAPFEDLICDEMKEDFDKEFDFNNNQGE